MTWGAGLTAIHSAARVRPARQSPSPYLTVIVPFMPAASWPSTEQ